MRCVRARVWGLTWAGCAMEWLSCVGSMQAYSVAVAPDGQTLVCCSDWTVLLWSLLSGECLRVFKGHSGEVSTHL